MPLTISRTGGMLPTLRPSVTHDLADLDAQTREAVEAFFASASSSTGAAHPNATAYVFELATDAGRQEVSVPFDAIPAGLRSLLPGPR